MSGDAFRFHEAIPDHEEVERVRAETVAHFQKDPGFYSRLFGIDDVLGLEVVLRRIHEESKLYVSSEYAVTVRVCPPDREIGWPEMIHLSIKRHDREAVHDWRALQQIKNAVVGPECEGVELYPAESRLVDTANQYHLFVWTSPRLRFPFGFTTRAVHGEDHGADLRARQRPITEPIADCLPARPRPAWPLRDLSRSIRQPHIYDPKEGR